MYCPKCRSNNIKVIRWDTCLDCGCVFKILNYNGIQQERGW